MSRLLVRGSHTKARQCRHIASILACTAILAGPVFAETASPQPIIIPTGLGDVTEVTIRPSSGAQLGLVQFEIAGFPMESFGMALISDSPLRLRRSILVPNTKWTRNTNGWFSFKDEPLKPSGPDGFVYMPAAGGMADKATTMRFAFEPVEQGRSATIKVTFFRHEDRTRGVLKDRVKVLSPQDARERLAHLNRRSTSGNDAAMVPHGAIRPQLALANTTPDVPANITPVLRPYAERLLAEGKRNAVINLAKLGLVSLENGLLKQAEWSFDQAIRAVETIQIEDSAASKARSLFGMEAMKDFKGEPYERAMLFYYRGLTYLARGDFQNARAAFKSGELFDTMASTEAAQSDFAMLHYLMGWTSLCLNDQAKAAEAFALASAADPTYTAPATSENTLALFEIGTGPIKEQRGNQLQLLTFTPSIGEERGAHAAVLVGTRPTPFAASTSIFAQASTRGGRPIDYLLDGEAKLQNSGNLATIGASIALAPVGLLLLELNGKVRADADARTWENLPDRVAVRAIATKPTDTLAFTIQPADAPARMVKPMLSATAGRCRIVWGRSRSAMETGPGTYGDDSDAAAMRAKSTDLAASDAAFIADLRRELEDLR